MKQTYKRVKKQGSRFLSLFFGLAASLPMSMNAQASYIFTSCGQTGAAIPNQAQANLSYTNTNLSGSVTVTGGIQTFTIPTTGPYRITAIGGQGGYNGGFGASIAGDYTLNAGTVLKILVGQAGTQFFNGSYTAGGGGGGSFVSDNANIPYVVAGGGGGNGDGYTGTSATVNNTLAGMQGNLTTSGFAFPAPTGGANGGSGGNGGTCAPSLPAGSGAGYYGNGVICSAGSAALAYVNGGNAGVGTVSGSGDGGFGGGGGGYSSGVGNRGGGGGGYSGGGGGTALSSEPHSPGGGGGSYNSGVNQVASVTTQTGNGRVIIDFLCDVKITASGSNSLNPSICSGQSLTLTTNAVSNYAWSNGNTTSNTIVVSPTTTSTYTVSGTSSLGCTSAAAINVIVSGGVPTLAVVSSTNQTCLGKTATLTASGAVTYTWTNGVTNGVSFFPTTTTTYTVSGQNGCGITTAVSTISVNPIAVSIASSHTAVCTNQTATLNLTAAANSFTWQPINVVSTNTSIIVNPSVNIVYTLSVSDGTCSGTGTVGLIANPVPTITSSSSAGTICPGGSVTFTANGGTNYTWTPSGQNGSVVTISPTQSGVYNVTGDNSFGCLGNSSQVVVVGSQPTVGVGVGSTTICSGASATLLATGANTYSWTGGPNTATYAVNPNQTTVYTVVGTNTTSQCMASKDMTVYVVSPALTITGNTTICTGSSANLTASGATTYTWLPDNTHFPSTSLAPTSTTIYTLTATSNTSNVNCTISTTVEVVVNPVPTVTAAGTPSAVCAKQTATLNASGASTYTWTSATGTNTGAALTVTTTTAGVIFYTVTATSAAGCVGETQLAYNVSACLGLDQLSPDGAQLSVYPNPSNGEFTLEASSELSLALINELGQSIKQVQLNEKNDHRFSVSGLPNGVYFIVGQNISRKIVVNK